MAANGGRVGAIPESLIDASEHTVEIEINLVIPKSQHDESGLREMLIALRILPYVGIKGMLAAVNLDYNPAVKTDEIEDVSIAVLFVGNESRVCATSASVPRA